MTTAEKALPPPPPTTLGGRLYASFHKTQGLFTKERDAKTNRTRKIIAYAIVGLLIVVAIVVGAVVGSQKRDSSTGGGGSNGGSSSGGPNGPSSFPLDPKLHNSFWGLAYTPYGAIDCTATQANVTKDMQILSQLTTRLRLYASDCNVTALVVRPNLRSKPLLNFVQLQAAQDLNVNMSIYAGIYVHPDVESYNSQVAQLDYALTTYGTRRVEGINIGNEYILTAISRGDTIVNATAWLVSRINDYKTHLRQATSSTPQQYHNYTSIPVGTSDAAGSYIGESNLLNVADYLQVNIHPWFSQNTYDQAAWFSSTYMENIVQPLVNATWSMPANSTTPNPRLFQGEFGWPTDTDDAALGVNPAGSRAGLTELQRVLDDWVCPSNRNGTKYFFFEAFDEPWKKMYGGVEQHWGLFYENKTLKAINIPDCPHD